MNEHAHFDTIALHAGYTSDPATHSFAAPIYQTASYAFDNTDYGAELFALSRPGHIYSRISNPTVELLENRLAALEGAEGGALALASGMAAITYAVQNITRPGEEIVAIATLYGGSVTLFSTRIKRLSDITVRLVPPDDLDALEAAINEKTRAVYIETIGNPDINIPDIEAIAAIAHKHGLPLIADNTFGTPRLIRMQDFGVDIVVHSLTKYIGGHGTSIGGAVADYGTFAFTGERFKEFDTPDDTYHGLVYNALGKAAYITKMRVQLLRDTGACLSPFNAFLFLQGIETLSLRVERHCSNAQAVAEYLSKHPAVAWVNYPGLPGDRYHDRAKKYFKDGVGGILGFGMKGGRDAAARLMDNLKLFSNMANVADARSLVIHPASTTHAQLSEEQLAAGGVKAEAIRMSVGLEDPRDLIADLEQGLATL